MAANNKACCAGIGKQACTAEVLVPGGWCVEHSRQVIQYLDREVRDHEAALEESPWNKELLRHESGNAANPALSDQMEKPRCTDLGNALRFARQWHECVIYVPEARGWFTWTGKAWRFDTGKVEMARLASLTAQSIFREAADLDASTDEGKALRDATLKWAKLSESKARIEAMVDLAKVYCRKRRYEDFDRHSHLFNAANCTIDLRTGEARTFDRRDLMTKVSLVELDWEAECPRWEQFLREVQPGHDACCIPFIRRMAGYWLTGETREECFFVLYGPLGRNGKGTFIETIAHVLGDWVKDSSFDTFVAKRGDEKLNDIAGFRGSRLVVASESEASKRLAEAKLKRMTGGDSVVGEFKYQEQFSYRPTYKIALVSNYKPKVVGTDNGIWDRIRLLEFPAYFGEGQRDVGLKDALKAEAKGILKWMVLGAREWYERGLQPSECVRGGTEEYRNNQNVLGQFIEERCATGAGLGVGKGDLYEAYRFWAEHAGEFVMSKTEFIERMGTQFEEGRTEKARIFRGIALRRGAGIDQDGLIDAAAMTHD